MRKTKIIATIGPASDSPEQLDRMIAAGMDVARLNTSHSGPAELATRLEGVRAAAERAGRHIAVMLDLAGPKIRIGEVASGTVLSSGDAFTLVTGECVGDSHQACITYEGFPDDVSQGNRLLLDDGRIELRVEKTAPGRVETSVVVGGPLISHKGVNAPGIRLSVEPVTRFDRAMAEWAVSKGVDYVAQSFVREQGDIVALRHILRDDTIPIVAKIEKHEAAANIDSIIREADAIMVARGDLGVETSPEEVPVLQRQIISAARASGTPVIVATQMLESMTTAPRPTRAEASDVANAIFDRADAVMLSAETAVGSYPVESVSTMARIAATAEGAVVPSQGERRSTDGRAGVPHAVSAAVCQLAESLDLSAIVTATQTGATARAVACHRPDVPLIAVTPSQQVARQLSLVWGVQSVIAEVAAEDDASLESLAVAVRDAGLAKGGEKIALTAGVVRGIAGGTDLILVRDIPER